MEYLNAEWFDNKLLSDEDILKENECKKIIKQKEKNDIFDRNFTYICKLYKSKNFHKIVESELFNIDKYKEEYEIVDKLAEIEYKPIEYISIKNKNKNQNSFNIISKEQYTISSIQKYNKKYNANVSNFEKIIKDKKKEVNNDNNDITVFLRTISKLNIQDYLQNVKLWLDYNNINDIWKRQVYVSQAKYFWNQCNGK